MLFCVSANFHQFRLEELEKFFIPKETLPKFVKRCQEKTLEILILQTCNRIEIYYVSDKLITKNFFWPEIPKVLLDRVVSYRQSQVANHLFRVGCAIESMAIGATLAQE